jgi:hypothetical protein
MATRVNRRNGTKTQKAQWAKRAVYRAQLDRRKNKTKGA